MEEIELKIEDTLNTVKWENNEAVRTLREQLEKGPISISMRKYGGFEQVGDLREPLPSDDTRITTVSGDIVLYEGNQIVIFYGSNTWEYTKLGHITDGSWEQLADKDVVITLSNKEEK